MLQQTPEYKRLPLHRIHNRRLSTKDFNYDYVPPTTAPHHASTIYDNKTQPDALHCNGTLVHHGGMHYSEPKDHQQAYRAATPTELATTLWPPHTTNYWFPNWKELFHGFVVVQKGGQPQPSVVAGLEQRGGIHQQNSGPGLPPWCSGITHQSLYLGSNNGTITSIHNIPSSKQPTSSPLLPSFKQHNLQQYTNDTTQSFVPLSVPSSHDVADPPALSRPQENDHAQIGDARKTHASPSHELGAVTKSSVKSPLWLPQGWITESHIRKTGTTAGTCDKYFRHLMSGRRFRTRKDVLHFVSTGKCRARKQTGGKNVLALSAGHSLMKTFTHKKLGLPEGCKPLQQGPEYKHSDNVANLSFLGHSEPASNDDFGSSCMQSNSICSTTGSIQPPGHAPIKERSHKLAVKKKAKPGEEDKQASKLWQWLTKPVTANGSMPLNQGVTLTSSSPSVEKKAIIEERSAKELGLKDQTTQRTSQLSKEIQAAHNNVIQMSMEMQATVEKLRREILVAQKDVQLGNEMEVSKGACDSLLATDNPESGKSSNPESGKSSRSENRALSLRYHVTNSVLHQAFSMPAIVTTDGLPRTTQLPTIAAGCSETGLAQRPMDIPNILKGGHLLLQATAQSPTTCPMPLPENQPLVPTSVMMHPQVQSTTMTHAATENGAHTAKRHGEGIQAATQPAHNSLSMTVQKQTVAVGRVTQQTEASAAAAKANPAQPAIGPEVPLVYTPNVLFSQMTSASSGCSMQPAEMCAMVAQPVNIEVIDATHTRRNHVLTPNHDFKHTEANVPEPAKRQTRSMAQLAQMQVFPNAQPTPSLHGVHSDVIAEGSTVVAEQVIGASIHRTQQRQPDSGCSGFEIRVLQGTADCREGTKQQQMDEVIARRLRRKKFSAVLNPKLDLSRLSPSLTARQRAKVVERMKAKHARELLATLGKHICRKAVRRKP